MSDSDKKLDELLQLRLITVTEDPTFQGKRAEYSKVAGAISESDLEARHESEKSGSNSIH